jgi:hypothetical protein
MTVLARSSTSYRRTVARSTSYNWELIVSDFASILSILKYELTLVTTLNLNMSEVQTISITSHEVKKGESKPYVTYNVKRKSPFFQINKK